MAGALQIVGEEEIDSPSASGLRVVGEEPATPQPTGLNARRGGSSGIVPPAPRPWYVPKSMDVMPTSYSPGSGPTFAPTPGSGETGESEAAASNEAKQQGLETAFGIHGYPKIVSGVKKVVKTGVVRPGSSYYTPPQVTPTEEQSKELASGTAEALQGVGEASTPLIAEAAGAKPITTGLGFLAGYGASKGAGAIAHGRTTPENEELIRQLAFWAPGLAGTILGPRVGVGITPEEVSVRAGVNPPGIGPKTAEFRFSRGGKTSVEPAGNGPIIEGQATPPAPGPTPAEQALLDHSTIQARAANVVQGKPAVTPPPPPPGPEPPTDVANGHISPETVQGIGEALAKLPPNLRAQGIIEAHGTLSRVLQQQGKVVLPTGQLAIVDSPKTADKIAADLINVEVERQDGLSKATKSADEKPAAVTSTPTKAAAGEPNARVPRKSQAAKLSQAPLRVVGVESADGTQPSAEIDTGARADGGGIPPEITGTFAAGVEGRSNGSIQEKAGTENVPERSTPEQKRSAGTEAEIVNANDQVKPLSVIGEEEAGVEHSESAPQTAIESHNAEKGNATAGTSSVSDSGNSGLAGQGIRKNSGAEESEGSSVVAPKPFAEGDTVLLPKGESGTIKKFFGGQVNPSARVEVKSSDGSTRRASVQVSKLRRPEASKEYDKNTLANPEWRVGTPEYEARKSSIEASEGKDKRPPEGYFPLSDQERESLETQLGRPITIADEHLARRTSGAPRDAFHGEGVSTDLKAPESKPYKEPAPENIGFDHSVKTGPDIGQQVRKDMPALPRGERRKIPRTPEEVETQELWKQARAELGDTKEHLENLTTEQVEKRVEQLRAKKVESANGHVPNSAIHHEAGDAGRIENASNRGTESSNEGKSEPVSSSRASADAGIPVLRQKIDSLTTDYDNALEAGDMKKAGALRKEMRAAEADLVKAIKSPSLASELLSGESGSFEPGKIREFLDEQLKDLRGAREVERGIFDLEARHSGRVLKAAQMIKAANEKYGDKAVSDYAQIYHHLEDPEGVPLTPQQDEILDNTVLPVMETNDELAAELKDGLVPIENYVHRVVKGKGGWFDRIVAGAKGTGKGNILSKSAPQTKGRTMMALEAQSADGKRVTVAIKGNQVTAFRAGKSEDMGNLSSGMTTNLDKLNEKLEPLADRIIDIKKKIAEVPENDKAQRVAGIESKIAELQKERDTLADVKGRKIGEKAVYGTEITFGKRKAITEQIDELEKERTRIQSSGHMSNAGEEKMRRLKEDLTIAENQRARAIESMPTSELADKIWIDKNGKRWKITQATTKEIEHDTDLEYYHNAMASALTSNLQLAKAVDALHFINDLKASPEFKDIAFEEGKGNPLAGWKPTTLPQLRGYSFEPHYADVFNRYADKLQGADGPLAQVLQDIGDFMTTTMLLNPLKHALNVSASWAFDKGVTGFMPWNWRKMGRTGMQAIRDVATLNDNFIDAQMAGGPLQSHRPMTADITGLFFDQLSGGLENNEPWAVSTAKSLGMAPVELAKAIKKYSHKIAMMSSDIMFLQATYERKEAGMNLKDALRDTGKIIPEYRVPTHILNSKLIGDLMGSRWAQKFGGYHYGLLRSLAEVGKSALGLSEKPSFGNQGYDTAKGWDRLALLGLVAFGLYPLLDELAKKVTKDPHARAQRFGIFGLIDAWSQVKHGTMPVGDAIQRSVTPAPLVKSGAELLSNRQLYNGRQIYNPHDDWQTIGWQLGRYLMDQAGMLSEANRASVSETQRKKFLYGQVGIQFRGSDAERIAQDISNHKMGSEAAEPGEMEDYGNRRDILDALRSGNSKPLQDAEAKHELTHRQILNLKDRAKLTPLQDKVNGFTYPEFRRVYDAATAKEKQELEHIYRRKLNSRMKDLRSRGQQAVNQ